MANDRQSDLELYKVYIDDENQVWRMMEPGRRWNRSRLEWRAEWAEIDEKEKQKGERGMAAEADLVRSRQCPASVRPVCLPGHT